MKTYAEFIQSKSQVGDGIGFEPEWIPDFLFDFQREIVIWAQRRGRAAIFADCGMGKTPMQLVWAENIVRRENRPVLIVTPIAVGVQTVREAEKFGVQATRSRDGEPEAGITVTNYEMLHRFNPSDYAGVVCDESSAIKNFDGQRRQIVSEFMRSVKYRLLCTATAAPNDFIELGTSSEALGELGHMDMLSRFFKNDQNSLNTNRLWAGSKWRFKQHAEAPFWRWMSSWSRALRRPSDLGFEDGRFILPPLHEIEHIVAPSGTRDGYLFDLPAVGLREQREENRRTLSERCEMAAHLIASRECSIAWCHLNPEGDLLEKLIPGSLQVSGSDDDDEKEAKLLAFTSGDVRVLVTKPVCAGFGLNFQHCSHMVMFPSHSFEQYYQSVRRCWRFGQANSVTVEMVTTPSDEGVMKNLQRKAAQADKMFAELVAHMNDPSYIQRGRTYPNAIEVPAWA